MKKISLVFVFFVISCAGEPPVENIVCDHEVACAEYPAWQTEYTFIEGYSNYECEPCWRDYEHSLAGDCCACDPDTHHTWCDEDGTGIYHCSPIGLFEHEGCSGYCFRMYGYSAWFTNDDVCVGEVGDAFCDCGE